MRVWTSAFVLVFVLAGGAPTASAQAGWGVKGGVNFANLNFDPGDDLVDSKSRTGLVAGVFVTLPVGTNFDVQPEFLYSQKGNKFSEGGFEERTLIDYAEIPILFRYRTAEVNQGAFVLFGGPSLAFKVSAKAKAEFDGQEEEEDLDDEVESFDFGLVVGAGFEMGRFTIDGRYTWGLTNISPAASEDLSVKNKVFAVMVGVRF
jgi:Outer membrane protein beta-barrel domain